MKVTWKKVCLFMLLAAMFLKEAHAADSTKLKTVNVSILVPLYLDSVFSGTNYKYGNNLPKFILPALEFYNGVQLAADSLKQEGINARIEIVDSRKYDALQTVLNQPNKPALLIGVMQSSSELKTTSAAALNKNIPFISATYPNDGGVTANPNLLIANSTLKTHCFALYNYLLRFYKNNNLLFITRPGNADERIKNCFKEAEKTNNGERLKLKMINLLDTFGIEEIKPFLDSNKTNTIIGASLDNDFALNILSRLSNLKDKYTCNAFGMPTWDELPLDRPEYNGIDVFYSTAFVSYSENPAVFSSITKKFKKVANSRPSDMVFKGFEITYRYVKTLYEHPHDFLSHVNDSKYKMFNNFNFQPVSSKENPLQVDYLENKKIYFIKKTDGLIKGVYY